MASYSAPGTVITYSYAVTNAGNVTLTLINVTDSLPNLSPVVCPNGPLDPGNSETCTATYTTTQADVDAGSVTNSAVASGTPPFGAPTTTTPSSLTIPATQTPGITLAKGGTPSSFSAAGTTITYSYVVTNDGNVTLTAVTVTDPKAGLSAVGCPQPTLAPGAFETCTATYSTTQADMDAGSVTNTGTATGDPPSGSPVSDQAQATIRAVQSPTISLDKTASITSYVTAGTAVTYSYAVTNTGNVTLSPVTVTDDKLGPITCPDPSLAPGGAETCTATYSTTQADMDAGSITNTGTATGTPPTGPQVVATDSVTLTAVPSPAVSLTKSASINSFATAGTPVTYSYDVTNTGNVTLNPVTVADNKLGAVTCPGPSLAPNASETCTATYTTTQADVDAGGVSNTGTVTGTSPTNVEVTDTSSLTIPFVAAPSIGIDKSASPTIFSAAGAVISYSYDVTNSGNQTLDPVVVTDNKLGPITCPDPSLAPNASETCTATYTTTQTDVDAGSITNNATASGTPPTPAPIVTAESSATVTANQAPGISLGKSSAPTSFSAAGASIAYSYLVTNTGNVTLDPVTVTDPMPGLSPVTCPDASLAPQGSETCTATYTTTQTDVDAGSIGNTGTANGTPPTGSPVTDSMSLTVPANQSPAVIIVKSASPTSYAAPGVLLTYSYAVTNSGNVTLTNVHVVDPMPGLSSVSCPLTTLVPAPATPNSETCTATYTTTQADVDNGQITNTATVMSTSPSGASVDDTDTLVTSADQDPSITVAKTASISTFSAPGVEVTYSYLVTNNGNVTLNPVTVTDPMPGLSAIACPFTLLGPGASGTCTATYTTTQTDVDNGAITNQGTATGTTPSDSTVSDVSSLSVPATQNPGISLAKSASVTAFSAAGQPITYSYLVTNSGNVTLNPVVVTDPMPGLPPLSCPDTSSGPNDSETCTATYLTTQTDVDNGSVSNTGQAVGTPPSGPVVTATNTVKIPAIDDPAITLEKSASVQSFSTVGTSITYTYQVTNAGNQTLDQVTLTDNKLGSITCPDVSLAPGGSETCTTTYLTTQTDLDNGQIENTATVTGVPPTGSEVSDDSTLIVPAVQNPGIGLVKSADPDTFDAPGIEITYSYAVTNNGNVTLSSVAVTDPMPGLSAVSCPDPSLAPTDTETCTATYATTQADVDGTGITNTGTATGTTPEGATVSASDSFEVTPVHSPLISEDKTASVGSFSSAGTRVTYSYAVTNEGNVTLDPVTVKDPMIGLSTISCPDTSLAPAGTETCTATYTTTQADVDRGSVTNEGTATGTSPQGDEVDASDSVTIPAIQHAAISLVKSANISSYSAPGIRVIYSYKVTNTGNLTLDPVVVTDPMPALSAISCPVTKLAPEGTRDLHGQLHHHPDRRRCGQHHQYRHGHRHLPERSSGHRHVDGHHPRSAKAPHHPGQNLQSDQLRRGGHHHHLQLPGDQCRERHPHERRAVTDPMPALSAISCPGTTLVPGVVRDLHRHLHHHRRRPPARQHQQRRHRHRRGPRGRRRQARHVDHDRAAGTGDNSPWRRLPA